MAVTNYNNSTIDSCGVPRPDNAAPALVLTVTDQHNCPCLQDWIDPQIWHFNFATPSKTLKEKEEDKSFQKPVSPDVLPEFLRYCES